MGGIEPLSVPRHPRGVCSLGFIAGDLVAFSVDFGRYGSLASWVGQITHEDNTIDTNWHLVREVADAEEPSRVWADTLTGCDLFTRNASP